MPHRQLQIKSLAERLAYRRQVLRRRSEAAGARMLAAFDRLEALVLREDHYDDAHQRVDEQPRVPAGHPDGGQWTTGGGGGTSPPIIALPPPGIGHNQGPPLDDRPKVPSEPPKDSKSRLQYAKDAARWLAAGAARRAPPVAGFLAAIEGAEWLRSEWPSIRSYMDGPKTMEELIAGAQTARAGYHKHHMREQAAARADGFPTSMIDGADNVVSVPIYKHRQISGWYQTAQPGFGGLSPREYLRGKDWAERERVGRYALRKFGVLK